MLQSCIDGTDPIYEPEPVYRAANQAFAVRYGRSDETGKKLRNVMRPILRKYHSLGQAYPRITANKSVQSYAMREYENYPIGFEAVAVWDEVLEEIFGDEDETYQFDINMHRGIPTNRAERGELIKFVSLMFGIERPSVVEFGTSQMQVLAKLALHGRKGISGYTPAEVGRLEDGTFVRDKRTSKRYGAVINSRHFRMAHALGLDIFSPYDPFVQEHVRSVSFSPSEIAGASRPFEEYKKLDDFIQKTKTKNSSIIDYRWEDIGSPIDWTGTGYFDIAAFPFSLYQLIAEAPGVNAQDIAIENAKSIVNPNHGVIVIIDAADIKPDISASGGVVFQNPKAPFTTHAWIYSMAHPERGFRRILDADGGRINKVQLNFAEIGRLTMAKEFGLLA